MRRRRAPLVVCLPLGLVAACVFRGGTRDTPLEGVIELPLEHLARPGGVSVATTTATGAASGVSTTMQRAPAAGVAPGNVRFQDAEATWDRGALRLSFMDDSGHVEATPAALDLPEDWRRLRKIAATIENGPIPGRVELAVLGGRGRLAAGRELGAGSTATLEVDLFDLPLAADAAAPFTARAIRIMSSSPGRAARALRVRRLWAEATRTPLEGPRVDALGQRVSGTWPGKAQRLEDLKAAIADEARALETMAAPRDRDDFGGWTKGETWQETGYFGIERDGSGRFWMVDPLGRPFWSLGVTGVGTGGDLTVTRGRELLFAALPERGNPEFHEAILAFDGLEGVGFYRWNVLRKWGAVGPWRDRTLERLDRWGLNTVGAFTFERDVLYQKRVPVTRFLRVLQGAPVPHTTTGFADVFDPRWASHVDAVVSEAAVAHHESPWLIGYFVDHEPLWSQMRLLDAPLGSALRARWLALLNERYPTLDALNAAWRTTFRVWNAVRDLPATALPGGRAAEDLRALEAAYAEAYFSTVAKTLKKHDPNHLYLGCRFARTPPANEEIARAAGRHVDALSVDDPAPAPPYEADQALLQRWHALAGGKPILAGQIRAPLEGPRQTAAQQQALPASERSAYYVRLVTGLAKLPYVIGAHWHQYVDQPVTGRGPDGENQIVGFVDITDRPHEDLVAAAREAAAKIYETHAAAK